MSEQIICLSVGLILSGIGIVILAVARRRDQKEMCFFLNSLAECLKDHEDSLQRHRKMILELYSDATARKK